MTIVVIQDFFNKHSRQRKGGRLTALMLLCIAVLGGINLYLFRYPFMYEDEGIYLWFARQTNASTQSGVVWQFFVNIFDSALPGERLRIANISIGLMAVFFLTRTIVLFRSYYLALVVALLWVSSITFFSQTHRLRPEVLHTFLATLALFFLAKFYASADRKYFWAAAVPIALIPSTHVMGVLHLPGLVVFAVFSMFKNKFEPKKMALLLLLIILPGLVLLFSTQMSTFTAAGVIGLLDQRGSSGGAILSVSRSVELMKLHFGTWYADSEPTTTNPIIRMVLSRGNHLRIQEITLIGASFLWLFVSFCIDLYSKYKRRVTNEGHSGLILLAVGLLNVGIFILAIMLSRRLNNSYLVSFQPWFFLVFVFAWGNSWRLTKVMLNCLVAGYLIVSSYHIIYLVWPYRNTNFSSVLSWIDGFYQGKACSDFPLISAPYHAFFEGSQDAADIYKFNSSKIEGKLFSKMIGNSQCVVLTARHLYGFEYFAQFPTTNRLLEMFQREFDVIGKLELPFYNSTSEFKRKTNREGVTYPIGDDYVYHHGLETVWIFKLKDGGNLDRYLEVNQ